MVNSRRKGKVGELELVSELRELFPGEDIRRSQQYSGVGSEAMDIVGLLGLSIECKRTQALNLAKAMTQAQQGEGVPVVMHRKDREEWLATIRLSDLINFSNVIQRIING